MQRDRYLEKHLVRIDYSLDIRDNYLVVPLVWDDEWVEVMPIVRGNLVEAEAAFHMYAAEMERERAYAILNHVPKSDDGTGWMENGF